MKRQVLLFVKSGAPKRGRVSLTSSDMLGLEERQVHHKGYTDRHGVYHAPHVQVHHVSSAPVPVPASAPPSGLVARITERLNSLILPETNSNARSVNRKVARLQSLIDLGDPGVILSESWGTNTYGKRVANAARDIAGWMTAGAAHPSRVAVAPPPAPVVVPVAPVAPVAPAPAPAPVAAVPSSGLGARIAERLNSLILPSTNSNAQSVNRKVARLQSLIDLGDPGVLLAESWGINTYGKRLANAAREIAGWISAGAAPQPAAPVAPAPAPVAPDPVPVVAATPLEDWDVSVLADWVNDGKPERGLHMVQRDKFDRLSQSQKDMVLARAEAKKREAEDLAAQIQESRRQQEGAIQEIRGGMEPTAAHLSSLGYGSVSTDLYAAALYQKIAGGTYADAERKIRRSSLYQGMTSGGYNLRDMIGVAKLAQQQVREYGVLGETQRLARATRLQDPRDGDTKTVDGVEYRLDGGRWHRVSPDETPSEDSSSEIEHGDTTETEQQPPRGTRVEPNLEAMGNLYDSLRTQAQQQGYWRGMDDAAIALSNAVPQGTLDAGRTSLMLELEHGGKIANGAMMRVMTGPGRDIMDLVARLDADQDQTQLTARGTINAWGREGDAGTAPGPQEGDTKTVDGVEYRLEGGRWHRVTPETVAAPEPAAAPAVAQDKQPWQKTRAEFGVPPEPRDTNVPRYPSLEQIARTNPERLTDDDKRVLDAQKVAQRAHQRYLREHKRYLPLANAHFLAVQQAVREGRPVPDNVLAEYPNLARAYDEPSEGDTKTVDGVEYRLEGGRWHRVSPDETPNEDSSSEIEHGDTTETEQQPPEVVAGARNTPAVPVDVGEDRRVLENTVEQPYQSGGIKLSRGELTQRPAADQLPEALARHLRPHARDSVNLTLEKFEAGYRSFLVADGTGAGKTRQQLATAAMLRQKYPDESVLIVTQNTRVISDAFSKDAATMGVPIIPIENGGQMTGPGIYVTAYSRVGRGEFNNVSPGTVICDEAHNLKNRDSAKAQAMLGKKDDQGRWQRGMLDRAHRSLLMTATPGDKAEQVGYLCTAFGLRFPALMASLGYRQGTYGWELIGSREDAAMRMGAFFDALTKTGLMVKREVSMDNVRVDNVAVKLSAADDETMSESYGNMLEMVAETEPRYRGLAKMLGLAKLRTALEPMKLEAAVTAASEDVRAGKKVVVFANRIADAELPDWWHGGDVGENSTGTLDVLAERLEAQGIKVARLYGRHLNRSARTIDSFQNGDADVVIATPQAGGTGINLDDVRGDKPRSMLVMTAPFSALEAVQMIGRINRLTTMSRATVRFIQADGVAVDNWNYGIIQAKLQMLGAAVQGDVSRLNLQNMAGMSDEDIQALGASSVPVQDGPEIDLGRLGLRTRAPSALAQAAATGQKVYLNVPYDEREVARAHGARWDRDARKWYVQGDIPEPLTQYAPATPASDAVAGEPSAPAARPQRVYIRSRYEDRFVVRESGGRWDPERRQWYFEGEVPQRLRDQWSGRIGWIEGEEGSSPAAAAPPAPRTTVQLTEDQIDAIQEALYCVGGVCDGAFRRDGSGFNRNDAETGHALATLGRTLTNEEAIQARQLVWKYKHQFGRELADRMGAPSSSDGIGRDGSGRYYLNVPYSSRLVAREHGARWDPRRVKWYFEGDELPEGLVQFAKAIGSDHG